MIRRPVSENRFLLIPQTEHARIAGEFATAWRNSEFVNYPHLTELLFAIRHHDDGWDEWEMTVDFNPDVGLPRNFTEMDAAPSADIWRRCIAVCGRQSQRCGYWVSQHFSALAQQRLQSLETSAVKEISIIQAFVLEQQEYQNRAVSDQDTSIMTTGTEWLRFFDRLSLLVCCRLPTEPDVMLQPDQTQIAIVQDQTQDGVSLKTNANVVPLTLTVHGRLYAMNQRQFRLNRLPTRQLQLRLR